MVDHADAGSCTVLHRWVQAIVAATVVSMFAIVVNTITDRAINGSYVLLLTASAVFTATTTCFVLDFVMVMVIYGSHKFKVNPDNVATPLAASIGDIIIFMIVADFVYQGVVTIQVPFGITYLMCSLLQKKKDPDNAAIPYLTALGDLLGSVFLGLAFVILKERKRFTTLIPVDIEQERN
ncbi:Solute carrier family 41 member 2 [Operophtera brumata]|uniref:Solute carrier family 41 member 2 n=1 Tax=Operophtera brumata TaxID=104452 RepID=A0A0L7LNC4_OPEBR|nr:Solute carrier family 41 member 2 [Operophtera brumata]